ncbi:four helix bundle protein [Bacteroidota bacterium]
MQKENIVLIKSYDFALKIVKLYLYLRQEKKEFEISKQVLRSGTSIGSNAEEGNSAQIKKDVIAKFSVSLKESKETHYWLRLLKDVRLVDPDLAIGLLNECEELIRIITSILKTSKENEKQLFIIHSLNKDNKNICI